MLPRPNWKGTLKLSLVSCQIALYPAISEREKVSFNQINRQTGNRVRYRKVDEETGQELAADDIARGYPVGDGKYVEVTDAEIEAVTPESSRVIDIDKFVMREEIDPIYFDRAYYIVPQGKVGRDAYAVIRDVMKSTRRVALGRLVLTNREHVIALQARGNGIVGTLLHYPYEVRDEADYFDDIAEQRISREMLGLARHIVNAKSGNFEPGEFKDHYEQGLIDLINRKRRGQPIAPAKPQPRPASLELMEALRESLQGTPKSGRRVKTPSRRQPKKAGSKIVRSRGRAG